MLQMLPAIRDLNLEQDMKGKFWKFPWITLIQQYVLLYSVFIFISSFMKRFFSSIGCVSNYYYAVLHFRKEGSKLHFSFNIIVISMYID